MRRVEEEEEGEGEREERGVESERGDCGEGAA